MFSSKKIALALLPTLLLTGCSSELAPSASITPAPMTVCLAVDEAGFSDGGSNESAYYAVKQSVVSLGLARKKRSFSAKASNGNIAANLSAWAKDGCGINIAVGDHMAAPLLRAANANPETKFLLVDDGVTPIALPANVSHLIYSIDQGGMLAGYLAAATTKTGYVATFGSARTENVLSAIAGFRAGVTRYNSDHNKTVAVLGAPTNSPATWRMIGNETDAAKAKKIANNYFALGADIVFPVAGAAGFGAGEATLEHEGAMVIGIGRDWYLSSNASTWRDRVLASVQKQISGRVFEQIEAALNGSFISSDFLGTLDNDGVTLTGEHKINYPTDFVNARADLLRDIADETLTIN